MTAIDPYRTLGLTPGASQAEIKRAYRYLAKLYHPDSAGERALPRFLAIQAAYEALVEDPGRRRVGRAGSVYRPSEPPRQPWQADPTRARATRDAYRARSRRTTGGGGAGGPSAAPGTPPGPPDANRARSGPAGAGAGPTNAGAGPGATPGRGTTGNPGSKETPGSSQAGRSRRSRGPKATIGSTSYDGADKEPFAPAWEGATWYGAGSGTYWTLNPKEYADPRKHGPEYLARSRRSLGGPAQDGLPTPDGPAPDGSPSSDEPTFPTRDDPVGGSAGGSASGSAAPPKSSAGDRDPSSEARPWPPTRTAAAAGARGANSASRPTPHPGSPRRSPGDPNPAGVPPGWRPAAGPPAPSGSGGFGDSVPSALRRASMSLPGRLGLAVIGWIPLGAAVSAMSNALPACSGAGLVCSDPLTAGVWPLHLLLIALLALVPRLAVIAAYGAIAVLLVGLAATPILLAVGGARTPAGTATALGVVLVAAWIGGVILALSGRVELPPWRGPRARGPRVR